MKKTVLFMSIGLLLVTGCSKEEFSNKMEESNAELNFVFKLDGNSSNWEEISPGEAPSNQNSLSIATTKANNGNSVHAHGSFPGVVFSGTQNNGGAHGSATVNLDPFIFTLETECVMVEGNEAVYGGTIIERDGPQPPPGAPFNVGDHIYFKIIDNGQGNNADPDQFNGIISFSEESQCGVWNPSKIRWQEFLDFDVEEPGSVKINN